MTQVAVETAVYVRWSSPRAVLQEREGWGPLGTFSPCPKGRDFLSSPCDRGYLVPRGPPVPSGQVLKVDTEMAPYLCMGISRDPISQSPENEPHFGTISSRQIF